MISLKEYVNEGLLDRVKNKDVNHEALITEFIRENYTISGLLQLRKVKDYYQAICSGMVVYTGSGDSLTNGFFKWKRVKLFSVCDKTLKTLEGAPEICQGEFTLSNVKGLSDLKGLSRKIENLYIGGCEDLKTLTGAKFECDTFFLENCNNIKTLDGMPKIIDKVIVKDCNNLKSLEGAPQECSSFECCSCKSLSNIDDCPSVCRDFYCTHNPSLTNITKLPTTNLRYITLDDTHQNLDVFNITKQKPNVSMAHTGNYKRILNGLVTWYFE